ncbi:MAG: hypothetical protein R6V04_05550 [bacterium]
MSYHRKQKYIFMIINRDFFLKLILILVLIFTFHSSAVQTQTIYCGSLPALLEIRESGSVSIRITFKPVTMDREFPCTPVLNEKKYPEPVVSIREISGSIEKKIGNFIVKVLPDPLRIIIRNNQEILIQELTFFENGQLAFKLDDTNTWYTEFIWDDNAGLLFIQPWGERDPESLKTEKFRITVVPTGETKTVQYRGKPIQERFQSKRRCK